MTWQDKIRDPNCTACALHQSADWVCLMGTGPRRAKVAIVGEAPGAREDDEHAAFVGPSGQLLRESLEQVGINPAECLITNATKCRPPDNRTPTKAEARECSDLYLWREIQHCEFVLGVGNAPLQVLTKKSGITRHRGKALPTLGDQTGFFTFHPAYVLRSPQHKPTFDADLSAFARLVNGQPSAAAPTRVKLVRTIPQLKWLRRQLEKAPVISFDVETSSEGSGKNHRYHNPWDPDGRIVMAGFAWEEGAGVAVPIHHAESTWRDPDAVLRYLKPVLEDPRHKTVAHNGKFDCKWLAAAGVFIEQTFDTMLAAHILDENRYKGLKPLSQILLGADAYDVGEDLKDAYNMPLKRLAVYQAKDVDYTLRLYYLFRQQLMEQPRLRKIFTKLMMPASRELTRVEAVGMYMDKKRLHAATRKVERRRDQVEAELRSFIPVDKRGTLNLRSPQQVAEWLFGDLELPLVELTKTGNPSTNESCMNQLAPQHPAPKLLLEYRTLEQKYLRSYVYPWSEALDFRSRIHTNYKLFGTVTGRLSSDRPNLQQVPRKRLLRSCFGAPDGWVFIEGDYSQVELRIAAMLAREPTLLRIFRTGGDPHLATAVQITGLTPAQIKDSDSTGMTEYRKRAKPVNFGFLYGMGWSKFVSYARDNYEVLYTEEEAKRVRNRFFELYSTLQPWHDRQRRLVHALGRVSSPLGRVRHLPDVYSRDQQVVAEAERQAINSPVQSFASDLMLLSLLRLADRLDRRRCRVVGTVHDALLFEAHHDYQDEAVALIREEMLNIDAVERTFQCEITVPLEVEIKVGQQWGTGHVV